MSTPPPNQRGIPVEEFSKLSPEIIQNFTPKLLRRVVLFLRHFMANLNKNPDALKELILPTNPEKKVRTKHVLKFVLDTWKTFRFRDCPSPTNSTTSFSSSDDSDDDDFYEYGDFDEEDEEPGPPEPFEFSDPDTKIDLESDLVNDSYQHEEPKESNESVQSSSITAGPSTGRDPLGYRPAPSRFMSSSDDDETENDIIGKSRLRRRRARPLSRNSDSTSDDEDPSQRDEGTVSLGRNFSPGDTISGTSLDEESDGGAATRRKFKKRKWDENNPKINLCTKIPKWSHMRKRPGQATHRCKYPGCKMWFRSKDKLEAHWVRFHTNEAGYYRCPFCHQVFITPEGFVGHNCSGPEA